VRSLDLVAVFSLLEPAPVDALDPIVQKTYTLDSFTVSIHGGVASFECACRRSEPYLLAVADLDRIHPPSGHYACALCLNELRNARTTAERVAVWFLRTALR
jgi:hypothetical protein